jgi:hypothetical protein
MFDEGIVPMESLYMDVNKVFQDYDPEEVRKMKRKFRKLWRKEYRREKHRGRNSKMRVDSLVNHYGVGLDKKTRSKKQSNARKSLVAYSLTITKVDPLIKKMKGTEDDPNYIPF